MLSTCKSRKPRQPTRSRLLRRVYFAEQHDDRESTGTSQHRSEVLCRPDADKTPSQPCPCGDRHDNRIRSETDLGTNVTPTASSTPALLATRMPPQPRFIMSHPAMNHRSPGLVPPLRAPADGSSVGSKEFLVREEEEHVGSGVPWLQNFGIGVLVATLLAAVLTLALTADRPEGAIASRSSSLPLQDGKTAGSGSKMAAPMEPMNTPAKIRRKVTRRSLAGINLTTALSREAMKIAHRGFQHRVKNKTAQRRAHQRCGPRFYTHCARSRREAYYSARSRACAWTHKDRASLCNRGANRFPNLGSCLSSCARGAPRNHCFESAVFTDCSRQDVLEEWWFFDGTGCVQWNFPRGSCPSHGSATFRSRADCSRNCAQRRLHNVKNSTSSRVHQYHCHAPIRSSCSLRQMRFPYFADMTALGSARCVRASKRILLARRCLVGSNHFDSISACESMCGGRRQLRGTSPANSL